MFRFTSKKRESEILSELQSRQQSRPQIESRDSTHLSIGNARSTFYKDKEQANTTSTFHQGENSPVFDNYAFGKNQKPGTVPSSSGIDISSRQQAQRNPFGTYNFPKREKKQSYYIIPSSKAGLMDVFEKYKNYTPAEQTSFRKPPSSQQKTTRHFRALSQHSHINNNSSFLSNSESVSVLESQTVVGSNNNNQQNRATSLNNQDLLLYQIQQNLGINLEKQNNSLQSSFSKIDGNKYKQTHNSCFRGLSRDKITQMPFNTGESFPGPGKYNRQSQFDPKNKTIKDSPIKEQQATVDMKKESPISFSITSVKKKLKQIIPSSIPNSSTIPVNQEKISPERFSKQNPSFMFIADQRDRFGENQFINFFSNKNPIYCPGPGQYKQTHHTILDKQEKIDKVKDQRKLLKEWLNPKQVASLQQAQQIPVEETPPDSQYTPDTLCIYQFSYS